VKTIGVTGGAGFIGGYVREELRSKGYEVVVFDRSAHTDDLAENETYFLGDIRSEVDVTEFAAHVDGIVHLAAVLGTQETIQNPRPAAETNILGGLNVLEAANQYGLPVVYAGVGNHWMREHGGGTYTITKTTVEDFAKMYNKNRDGRVSVVRPVNAYGPRQSIASPYGSSKVRKILPSFTCRALLGEDIEVYGDGTQISDCVHVHDVASVFVRALEVTAEGVVHTDIEVGPVASVSVNDIAELVRQAAGTDSKIVHLPMRPGEVPNAVVSADVSTLKPLGINAENFIPLGTGVQETVDWYRENWLPGYQK
jgi:UDP-glucose 4-epimerase